MKSTFVPVGRYLSYFPIIPCFHILWFWPEGSVISLQLLHGNFLLHLLAFCCEGELPLPPSYLSVCLSVCQPAISTDSSVFGLLRPVTCYYFYLLSSDCPIFGSGSQLTLFLVTRRCPWVLLPCRRWRRPGFWCINECSRPPVGSVPLLCVTRCMACLSFWLNASFFLYEIFYPWGMMQVAPDKVFCISKHFSHCLAVRSWLYQVLLCLSTSEQIKCCAHLTFT